MAAQLHPSNLVDVLHRHAGEQPDKVAYTFLTDGETDEANLTYGELDRRARQVGAALQQAGCTNDRALLVYQPGLDYIAGFLGCLYAGVTAVPAYPPDPFRMERSFPRFQAIVADCHPAALLTTSTILEFAGELLDEFPEFQGITRFATDALGADLPGSWRAPAIDPSSLAFLQYTSGSTADPKGVMLSRANLMHNLELIRNAFAMKDASMGVIWLPPYHDMGLIGGILEPLYTGLPCTLLSPLDFLQKPMRWLRAISKYGATVSGGPNFAYDLCVRKATPEQIAALDLSRWTVAFSGAEPVRRETMERFAATFGPAGFRLEAFYPCYGLAEATLIVSGGIALAPPVYLTVEAEALGKGAAIPVNWPAEAANGKDTLALVGCGTTLDGQEIAIVDEESGERCPPLRVGEIWVSGESVACGYWENPAETERAFGATLVGSDRRFLRTGDLGFLDESGNLFVAGRIKDLIIVDGRNHYPQDIELTVEKAHPAFRPGCTAVFAVTLDGQERVIVASEIAKSIKAGDGADGVEPAALRAAIRKAIAENHDLRLHDAVFLKAGAMPKTSSGKIQRRLTRAAYLDGTLERWA